MTTVTLVKLTTENMAQIQLFVRATLCLLKKGMIIFMEKKKISLKNNTTVQVLIGVVVGILLGLIFGEKMSAFKVIGDTWLNMLKLILVPLVLCIMVLAVGEQPNLKILGRTAVRIFIYYFITTAVASVIGIVVAQIFQPGAGITVDLGNSSFSGEVAAFSITGFIEGIIPSNMFAAFVNGNMLQVMFIAIMFGICILQIKNEDHKATVLKWFQAFNSMLNVYIGFVIKLTPIGACFLLADAVGAYGIEIFGSMVKLMGTFYLATIIHVVIFYGLFLLITTGISPVKYIKETTPVWTFTLATCSSVANIPVSLKCVKEKFKVPSHVADFCIPLGAQINFDGMGILFGTVLVFMSQFYGVPMGMDALLRIVIVGVLISSGGGGLPSGGLIKLLIIVEMFGFPGELIGVIAGFYRFFDMGITMTNCMGDVAGTVFVSEWEKNDDKKLGKLQQTA